MKHEEKFLSAVKSRVSMVAEQYRQAFDHDKQMKDDIKADVISIDDAPPEEIVGFVVRVDEPKHSWSHEACKKHIEEIDSYLEDSGFAFYSKRGSSSRYGRGQMVSRFADTFVGFEDEVTRTLHNRYFDYYLRIVLMVRAGASDEEVIASEEEEATSDAPFLGEAITGQLAGFARRMSNAEKGLGAKGPILNFKTTRQYRGEIKTAYEGLGYHAKMKIPQKFSADMEPVSMRLLVGSFIELLMLAWEKEHKDQFPEASAWAQEFVHYYDAFLIEFRREAEFVKVGDKAEQLDLLAF